jgi:hypothetical protein
MALVAALASVGGLVGGGPSGGSWLGAATSVACAGVVVLLALPGTSVDFELAERARHRQGPSVAGSPSARGD